MGALYKLEQILSSLADDDQQAFEELFNHYYSRLYNFSKRFLKSEEGIDDILQEVFLKIWRNRKNIKSQDTFNSYLFTITQNLLLNEIRRRINARKKKDELFNASIAREYQSVEAVDYHDIKSRIGTLIEELPDRQKQIFKLSRIEGLSHKEIAKKLGVTTKTIEYHISQSIKILKRRLKSIGLISLLYICLFF